LVSIFMPGVKEQACSSKTGTKGIDDLNRDLNMANVFL
jgi:hypothetical protein